jgi:hypothetical protein
MPDWSSRKAQEALRDRDQDEEDKTSTTAQSRDRHFMILESVSVHKPNAGS